MSEENDSETITGVDLAMVEASIQSDSTAISSTVVSRLVAAVQVALYRGGLDFKNMENEEVRAKVSVNVNDDGLHFLVDGKHQTSLYYRIEPNTTIIKCTIPEDTSNEAWDDACSKMLSYLDSDDTVEEDTPLESVH